MNNDYGDHLRTQRRKRLEKITTEVLSGVVSVNGINYTTSDKVSTVALTIELSQELIKQLDETES